MLQKTVDNIKSVIREGFPENITFEQIIKQEREHSMGCFGRRLSHTGDKAGKVRDQEQQIQTREGQARGH